MSPPSLKGAILTVAILAVAACGSGAQTPPSGNASNQPIVIGAAVGRTGFISAYDGPPLQGAEEAVADVNAHGGVLGRPLKIIYADTKSDVAQGANAATTVLDQGAQLLIVSCDYDFGSGAAIVGQAKGVVTFSTCAASPKFGVQGIGNLAYTAGTATIGEGALLADWATKKKGWKSAYVLLDTTLEYTKTICQGFEQQWAADGGTTTGKDTFQNGDVSIASQITRMKSAPKADFLYICSYPPGGVTALKQLRSSGLNLPVVATESWDGNYWLDALPNLSNFYYAQYGSIYGDDPRPEVNQVVTGFKTMFGSAMPTAFALTGYAVIQLYARAANAAGSLDAQKVRAQLDKFNKVPTVLGPTTFTPTLHINNVDRPMAILSIQDGMHHFLEYYSLAIPPMLTFTS